jgi:hypothetical protein
LAANRQHQQAIDDAIKDKVQLMQRLLATPDGKSLMSFLVAEYEDLPLFGSTPEQTAYRVGQRDLVQRLRSLRDYNREE